MGGFNRTETYYNIRLFEKMKKFLSENPVVIICVIYLLLATPLLTKALWHDEVYSSSTYLDSIPKISSLEVFSRVMRGNTWSEDWRTQLAYHPPGIFTFYYFWNYLFGDSEVSLHLAPFILGLISIFLVYRLGEKLFGRGVSFFATLCLVLTSSYILYSSEGTHPIFELFIYITTLSIFYGCMDGKRNYHALFFTNLLGLLLFYHYFIYFIIQNLILFYLRKRLRIPAMYFAAAIFFALCELLFLGLNYSLGYYEILKTEFPHDATGMMKSIILAPHYFFIGDGFNFIALFYASLFILFLIGIVKIARSGNYKLLSMVVFLGSPYVAYLILSLFKIYIGWNRSFVYLTPLYFLVIFNWIRAMLKKKILFYLIGTLICTFALIISLYSITVGWIEFNAAREQVSKISGEDCIILPSGTLHSRTIYYYLNKNGYRFDYLEQLWENTTDFIGLYIQKGNNKTRLFINSRHEELFVDKTFAGFEQKYYISSRKEFGEISSPYSAVNKLLNNKFTVEIFSCTKLN